MTLPIPIVHETNVTRPRLVDADCNLNLGCAMTFWFRRDTFHSTQYLASQGGWNSDKGWLIRIKESIGGMYIDNIEVYTFKDENTKSNYRTRIPIADRKDHFFAFVWDVDRYFPDGVLHHRFFDEDGRACNSAATDCDPAHCIMDGEDRAIRKSWYATLRDPTPSPLDLCIGGKVEGIDDEAWSGVIYEFKFYRGQGIRISDLIDYYHDTKGRYNVD